MPRWRAASSRRCPRPRSGPHQVFVLRAVQEFPGNAAPFSGLPAPRAWSVRTRTCLVLPQPKWPCWELIQAPDASKPVSSRNGASLSPLAGLDWTVLLGRSIPACQRFLSGWARLTVDPNRGALGKRSFFAPSWAGRGAAPILSGLSLHPSSLHYPTCQTWSVLECRCTPPRLASWPWARFRSGSVSRHALHQTVPRI